MAHEGGVTILFFVHCLMMLIYICTNYFENNFNGIKADTVSIRKITKGRGEQLRKLIGKVWTLLCAPSKIFYI